ncbi:M14 family zinc carboxypeptidase [Parashewanella tropica]|uniref:M14 family zinc carboxypeptidase n=1 Tax=Parashewanella tropica TaxID=2547970 RepID=UPI001059262D|nr:M14 family zinc carboxypeptidase [Parashewanella tropica]
MKKLALLSLSSLLLSSSLLTSAHATIQTEFELPSVQYTSNLMTPENYLGYPLGEWHLRHDQLNGYLKLLAQQSAKVSLEDTGYSHERRQQLSVVITSEENQQRLNEIINQRATVKTGNKVDGPLVVWLAYSIHGDEASGAHAAMALSYYLSASNEPWVKQLLDDMVVIVTPSQNPDGMDRFANWANNNRSNVLNLDPNNREHHQHWERGRFNHYLADLNRDWLFLRHPESQGRVALFHKWQPHYVGDFHEMGHRSSYFFQPGVPERTHPLTPKQNQALTDKIANYHRSELDKMGQPYFSKQSFDDFFYGKGSTYPDINGAIGVLFEQASARGKGVDSPNGAVTLERAIQNQFATSISSLKGTLALKKELHDYQAEFFDKRRNKAGRQEGVLLSAKHDPHRLQQFAEILAQHNIDFEYLNRDIKQNMLTFAKQDSLFIPYAQPQHALTRALFDKRQSFKDETFYDVSSFDLSAAFDLQLAEEVNISNKYLTSSVKRHTPNEIAPDSVAVLIDWQQSNAAPFLQSLLAKGIDAKFSTKPLTVTAGEKTKTLGSGTLQILLKQDDVNRDSLVTTIKTEAKRHNLNITPVSTFAAVSGIDLGSPNFVPVTPVKPLLVTSDSTNPMEVGQLWNFLDNTLNMPVTLVDADNLSRINLNDYSHVLFAHGWYASLTAKTADKLKRFAQNGGTIVAQKAAVSWLKQHKLLQTEVFNSKQANELFDTKGLTFGDQENLRARKTIGGAIVNIDLDNSHPLNFGVTNTRIRLMKNHIVAFEAPKASFISAGQYHQSPLASGYMAPEYQQHYPKLHSMIAERLGRGRVIGFAENLVFRNVWLGSEKIYSNALFFSNGL